MWGVRAKPKEANACRTAHNSRRLSRDLVRQTAAEPSALYLILGTLFRQTTMNGLELLAEETLYNGRVKYRREADGTLVPLEIMYVNRLIFNPEHCEVSNRTKLISNYVEYRDAMLDDYPEVTVELEADNRAQNLQRSIRRASGQLRDYILCNNFDLFCTLTLDSTLIKRDDYGAVIRKLNTYLDNRVRRNGLVYVGVPELHKKGGIHFHFLCNSEAMKLVDSGCVSVPGHKRPIKVATAKRLHIPPEDWHTVYNIADWTLGFTTAIKTYGERGALAKYLTKYLTKDMTGKIGGRWYYSGGKLQKPVYKYERGGFADVTNYTYDFQCDGGMFKVALFNDKGEIIHYEKDI